MGGTVDMACGDPLSVPFASVPSPLAQVVKRWSHSETRAAGASSLLKAEAHWFLKSSPNELWSALRRQTILSNLSAKPAFSLFTTRYARKARGEKGFRETKRHGEKKNLPARNAPTLKKVSR